MSLVVVERVAWLHTEPETRAATEGTAVTIIVSVKINDGVVMAADSASTFATGQIYLHTNKITNLVKGLPIGVMVTGAGGIGSESIETLCKDLRTRLFGVRQKPTRIGSWIPRHSRCPRWQTGPWRCSRPRAAAADQEVWMLLRLCGLLR